VFGDAIGGRVADPKKAWATTCRRAQIEDLHFHDLRHEAGSRWIDRGWPVSHVQVMLGHANLSQTSTYLNLTENSLQDSMAKYGTEPLHVVAPEPDQEPQPSCNEEAPTEKQVTVN
jgi:integrase